jgi:outer membrane protein TolC
MLEENKKILKQSIEVLQKTYNEMKAMNVSGFVDETSVDQLKLTLSGVENVEKSMSRQLEVSYNLLKYNMGVSLEENIVLSDNLETLFNFVNADTYVNQKFNKDNNINFQLLYTAEKLSKLNMKKEIMTFLPQLSAFYSYKRSAMGNEFNFFDSGTKWFPTQVIGISLKVPIFSSGMRYAKYQQAKLDLEKTRNTKKLVADGLELEYQQAKSEFSNALEKYVTEKENKVLAQKIYDNTLIKFKQGVGSSMDLTQANNQLISSQTNFIKAMFDFLNSKNRIDKVLNNY